MAIVPADEFGRPEHSWKIFAGDSELPIMRSSGSNDHRVVNFEEFADRHIASDSEIANQLHSRTFRDLLVSFADGLQRLVVGSNAEADQAERNRVAIEHVDLGMLAEGLVEGLGGIKAGRTRPDDCKVPHWASFK